VSECVTIVVHGSVHSRHSQARQVSQSVSQSVGGPTHSFLHTYIRIRVYVYTYTHTHVSIRVYVHRYMRIEMETSVCLSVCVYVRSGRPVDLYVRTTKGRREWKGRTTQIPYRTLIINRSSCGAKGMNTLLQHYIHKTPQCQSIPHSSSETATACHEHHPPTLRT